MKLHSLAYSSIQIPDYMIWINSSGMLMQLSQQLRAAVNFVFWMFWLRLVCACCLIPDSVWYTCNVACIMLSLFCNQFFVSGTSTVGFLCSCSTTVQWWSLCLHNNLGIPRVVSDYNASLIATNYWHSIKEVHKWLVWYFSTALDSNEVRWLEQVLLRRIQ